MSFEWLAFLSLAEYMNDNAGDFPDEEACSRTVVSRAYYAVFGLARNYARDFDNVTFHSNDHQALQDHFIKHAHKSRSRLGNRLRELHQHRIKADYHDELGESPVNKASRALTQARRIVQSIDEVFQDRGEG